MKNNKEILIDFEGNFKLYILQPVYKELSCSHNAFFLNKNTGENCGEHVLLCVFKYNNDGTVNEKPFYEEDCYDVVAKEQ